MRPVFSTSYQKYTFRVSRWNVVAKELAFVTFLIIFCLFCDQMSGNSEVSLKKRHLWKTLHKNQQKLSSIWPLVSLSAIKGKISEDARHRNFSSISQLAVSSFLRVGFGAETMLMVWHPDPSSTDPGFENWSCGQSGS